MTKSATKAAPSKPASADAAEGAAERETFVTSKGREIDYNPGHLEFMDRTRGKFTNTAAISDYVDRASTLVAGDYDKISSENKDSVRLKESKISLWSYSHRYAHACMVPELLRGLPVKRKFKRMLDIGCGFGVQPAILKGIGVVEEAHGIDIVDRASAIKPETLQKLHRRMRYLKYVDGYVERLSDRDPEDLTPMQRAIVQKVQTPRLSVYRASGIMLPKTIYNNKLVAEPKLDAFWEADVYKHEERYDLITAFSCVEWFRSKELFQKVADMLEVGGIFYMYVANWWGGNAAVRANGLFPYAIQRLDDEEREDYVKRQYPDNAAEVRNLYEYYDTDRPTQKDYIEAALQANLVPVVHRMAVAPYKYAQRRGITPLGYAIDDHARFREALEDIRRFRPDVGAEDLLSSQSYLAFMRVDPDARMNRAKYQEVSKKVDFHYRPKGPIERFLREKGLKFLLK